MSKLSSVFLSILVECCGGKAMNSVAQSTTSLKYLLYTSLTYITNFEHSNHKKHQRKKFLSPKLKLRNKVEWVSFKVCSEICLFVHLETFMIKFPNFCETEHTLWEMVWGKNFPVIYFNNRLHKRLYIVFISRFLTSW